MTTMCIIGVIISSPLPLAVLIACSTNLCPCRSDMCAPVICVSPHTFTSDMCTPSNMAASDMCIPHPPPLQKINNYG